MKRSNYGHFGGFSEFGKGNSEKWLGIGRFSLFRNGGIGLYIGINSESLLREYSEHGQVASLLTLGGGSRAGHLTSVVGAVEPCPNERRKQWTKKQ